MELISAVVCLLLGSAIPVVALFFFVRRGMRQLQVAHAYAETSRLLGLDVDTRGVSLHGHLGDRRLWIGEVMVGHGPDRHMMTWGVMDMRRPLGMGLTVRRNTQRSAWRRRSKKTDISLGSESLDRHLFVRADDPEAASVLVRRGVATALAALIEEWPDVAVTDHSVRVHLNKPVAQAAQLQQLVSAMSRLCDALERSRAELPPPETLGAHRDTFEELARARSLNLEPWLPACSGVIDGHRVLVCARRSDHGYHALIRLWFAAHDRVGLHLKHQTGPDDYWSVGQDIRLGDEDFDSAFVVKGWDPEKIRGVLTPDARQALLKLSASTDAEVDDTCLVVEEIPLDIDSLTEALDLVVFAAHHFDWTGARTPAEVVPEGQ